jgi:hypothetical protein
MLCKKSDELIVAMKVKPMTNRTCAAGCRGRRFEEKKNLTQRRGSSLDRVEVNSMITPIGSRKDTRKVSTAKKAIKRSLVTVYEDSGTIAGSRNRWRQ